MPILIYGIKTVSHITLKFIVLLAEIISFKTAPRRKWSGNWVMKCKFWKFVHSSWLLLFESPEVREWFCSGKIHLEIVEFLQEINCFEQYQLQVKTIRQALQRWLEQVGSAGTCTWWIGAIGRIHQLKNKQFVSRSRTALNESWWTRQNWWRKTLFQQFLLSPIHYAC